MLEISTKTLDSEIINRFTRLSAIVFDFDGVFTDNTVAVDQNGTESVRCWRSDGLGLSRLKTLDIKTLILSTEKNLVVSTRAKKLKTECIQGVDNKEHVLKTWIAQNELNIEEVAFVGNDINDIGALKTCGIPIAVADAYPEILPFVKFVTTRTGGHGAVREICDLIFELKSKQKVK
jgi:3-deoxy-D-manno-octulosonate 8-phosphate phosphatase (KDO 8-P phosphatase)